ncbi:MAG: hypothetical protein IK072_04905 [Clostridia bacterium]|nr:hypothetical protein [Clostridia bacterium]
MKKERIKSILLIMLIITNLVLAEKILVNEKLWLSGYNFFISTRNNRKKNSASVTESLSMPEKIIVNTGYQSSRFIYTRASEHFADINATSSEVIKSALSDTKSVLQISAEDWYSALTAKSLYLSYSCLFTPNIYASFLGIPEPQLPIAEFSDIVIGENGNVYLGGDGTYCKIPEVSSLISPIIQSAAEEYSDEESVINYSFDLNFDKNSGDETTVLSPMILIYSEPVTALTVIPQNPVQKDSQVNEKALSNILPVFGVNKSSARRYTEADGTLVYVENNGILKITPSGILTFTARGNGIRLQGGGDSSKIASFIDNVNSKMDIDADICLTLARINDNTAHFEFDYTIEGYPVKYKDTHAFSATLENGYLTEYSQILRRFNVTDNQGVSPDFIQALDDVIASYRGSLQEMRITKMYPAFFDVLSGEEMSIDWNIDVDNILAQ